ncbi:ATP-dependent helicase [Miltoncostaea oceani]|uniref:ATP-dependent helicase n=1 Tax=Miltoncostaea oceani TaxID=2843216 RepID=UPI001C3C9544|nr:ATP-dependent DNA helicase [Miltoncostaea oceani]
MTSDLTPEQRAAVTHPGGPAIVLAGAGAGKTRVLCRRLAWLVGEGAAPDEILALTFTREAAVELRARAEDLLGTSHETLRVTTFHSYAQELTRIHGVERGLLPSVTVARTEDRMLMLLDRLDELDLRLHDLRGDRAQLVEDLVARIDACRDQLVPAEAYRRWAEARVEGARSGSDLHKARRELEIARVYETHDRWLAEEGREDFGLSIVRALELMRAHPDRREAAQAGARHVLVDEFQDTNHAQAELLYAVAGASESLVVVGDDDQGIYRFRGASAKNILDFRARYPAAAELRLERNHRSTQTILDAATAVVAPIADRAPKHSVALPDAAGPPPRFWIAPDPDGQARAVVERIVALAGEGVPLEEQAVLMRAVRLEARPLVEALERAGVPHQVRGGIGLFERREVRAAVAWLRAACDPSAVQEHLRIGADPRFGIPWEDLADAVTAAAAGGGGVTGALGRVARAGTAGPLADALDEIGRAAAELPAADALRVAIDRSGLRAAAIATGGAEGAARLAGLAALERLGREIAGRDPAIDAPGLSQLLAGLAAIGYRGEGVAPRERIGVQVMTIHQAKGLEFDAVFVVGMTRAGFPGADRSRVDIPDQLLPEVLPRGRDAHVAEARRLAYVAMTRARRHLVLCAPAHNGAGIAQTPSPFFEEARAVLGAEVEEVGEAPERALLAAVGVRRAAFERASLRAAQAAADGAADADAMRMEAARAADALVDARAAVLRPPPPPAPVVAPARPARPGLEISPSAVELYRGCPLRYRYAMVDHVPSPPSVARAIGVAAHSALEAQYRPDGPGGDGEALVRRFAVALKREGVADTAEGRQALARGRDALPDYHDRLVRSRTRPVAVERAFTLTVGPHRVHGRIDRIDAHPAGGHQLVDYKTGKPPTAGARGPGDDLVLRLYMLGAREAWGITPRGATLVHVLDGDTRGVHPDASDDAMVVEAVRDAVEGISARDFTPRPSWACRSCDFALICPAIDR